MASAPSLQADSIIGIMNARELNSPTLQVRLAPAVIGLSAKEPPAAKHPRGLMTSFTGRGLMVSQVVPFALRSWWLYCVDSFSALHLLVLQGCCLDLQCSSESPFVGGGAGGSLVI